MPMGTPIATVTTTADSVSFIVAGMAPAIISATGWRVWNERPRSPWRAFTRKSAYCTGSGRSSPSSRRMRAMVSGSARFSKAAVTGSPGTTCIRMKVMRLTPRRTGTPCRRRRTTKASTGISPRRPSGRGPAGAVPSA